jgi:ferritin-like metal-binding protein YciE
MAATSLQELFVEELRDMYDGEKRLKKALPKMARAASASELETAFTSHLRETEKQVARLEQVFRALGEPIRGKKCEGIVGIVEEGKHAMESAADRPRRPAPVIAGIRTLS